MNKAPRRPSTAVTQAQRQNKKLKANLAADNSACESLEINGEISFQRGRQGGRREEREREEDREREEGGKGERGEERRKSGSQGEEEERETSSEWKRRREKDKEM